MLPTRAKSGKPATPPAPIPPSLRVSTAPLFTSYGDQDAAIEAARLLGRGRRVRFVLRSTLENRWHVEAVDANPWAAGWNQYGRLLEMQRRWWFFGLAAAPVLVLFAHWMRKAAP